MYTRDNIYCICLSRQCSFADTARVQTESFSAGSPQTKVTRIAKELAKTDNFWGHTSIVRRCHCVCVCVCVCVCTELE